VQVFDVDGVVQSHGSPLRAGVACRRERSPISTVGDNAEVSCAGQPPSQRIAALRSAGVSSAFLKMAEGARQVLCDVTNPNQGEGIIKGTYPPDTQRGYIFFNN
jgi:hypothetical protein